MKDLYIITGATGGMGYEAAEYFSKKGRLLLLDLSLESLNQVKDKLKGDIDILKFDITKEEDINNLVSYIKEVGGFKYLLHFAGVSESMGKSDLIYKINLIGSSILLNAVYDYIKPGGVVLNVSSMTAHMTKASNEVIELLRKPLDKDFLINILKHTENTTLAYGWSKIGIIELTKIEAPKWGEKEARIVSISPGAILTPMVKKEMEKNSEAINQLINLTPMKRIGMPADIINLVDFLISDKASFITGTDILIDGGVTEVWMGYNKLNTNRIDMLE